MSQAPVPDQAPDVRHLRDQALPEQPFPGGRGQDFRVWLGPEAYGAIWAHAREDTSVEICGVLVGTWARDADGPFVRVTDAIRGEAARNKFAEVTFTHDTWARINAEMDRNFADKSIVGWYHTHPDFGVFLSDRDRFIHEHFFAGPGQVALVVDPIRRTEGVFTWSGGKPALVPHFWAGDRVVPGTAAGAEAHAMAPLPAAAPAPAASPAPKAEPSILTPLTMALAFLCLFLLGYLLGGMRSTWEESRLVEGVVAHYGLWKGLRPDLGKDVRALDRELVALARDLDALAADHRDRLAKPADAEAREQAKDITRRWGDARARLTLVARQAEALERRYALSPQETEAVGRLVLEKLRQLGDTGPTSPPATADAGPGKAAPDAAAGTTTTDPTPKPAPAGAGNSSEPKK